MLQALLPVELTVHKARARMVFATQPPSSLFLPMWNARASAEGNYPMPEQHSPAQAESDKFDVGLVTTYWLTEADEALQVADHLVEKTHYSYALFFGHLAVEKILKALYVARRR